ncbi:MAG: Asp23/Gls24 family envelope stress response protein [Anaerolineae bacterium]
MPLEQDRIIVHPQVLATIAALTALSVPGVARLRAHPWAWLTRWLRRCRVPGVQLRVDGDMVSVDLYLVINAGFGLLEVSRCVQAAVERAIAEMTDMQVRQVNVHVDGVRAATYS